MVNKKDNKFEGSPTKLLMGAEAAPDHPMGETCIWCEHDTAIEIEEAWHDPNYDKKADTNWTAYKCSTCGCEFVMGTKCTAFNDITKAGKLELSVDVPEPHPCEHPTPCKHSVQYSNNGYPCNLCERNETQIHGRDHIQYGDHWEAK